MPHTNRNNRHKRRLLPRQGRSLQAGDGVGHRDMVRQAKKFMLFGTAGLDAATGSFGYGLRNVNVSTTVSGISNAVYERLMATAALTYEEYRIRRVVLRAQPGLGFTNDDRIKASIFARVDVNSQPTAATLDNLNSLISSESAVNRTFTERSNVKLVDYAPVCYSAGSTGSSSRPILTSNNQWYNIEERSSHVWRGATVAPIIADNGIAPNTKGITVWVEVEVEFRSRRTDFASLALTAVKQ